MDTKLKELIINEVTEEKLKELEDANAIPPNELFVTEDEDDALIIDEALDVNSVNPIANKTVAQKFTEITPSTTFAEVERQKSKNLFNKYTNLNRTFGWSSGETVLQSDGTIKATANFNNGLGKGAVVYLKPNTQYCLSFKQVGFEEPNRNGNIRVSAVNNEETSYTEIKSIRIWSDMTSYSIPFITTDTGIIHISFGGSQNASDVNSFKYILYDDVQIEEGAVATDYQPYGGGPITHNGDAPVVFAESERQKSKNLFNYEAFRNLNPNKISGSPENFNVVNISYTNVYANFKPNTAYTISGTLTTTYDNYQIDIYYKDGTHTMIGRGYYGASKTEILDDTSDAAKTIDYIKVSIFNGCTLNFTNFQIEEGTVATDYQPYNGAIVYEKDIEFLKKYPIQCSLKMTADQNNVAAYSNATVVFGRVEFSTDTLGLIKYNNGILSFDKRVKKVRLHGHITFSDTGTDDATINIYRNDSELLGYLAGKISSGGQVCEFETPVIEVSENDTIRTTVFCVVACDVKYWYSRLNVEVYV